MWHLDKDSFLEKIEEVLKRIDTVLEMNSVEDPNLLQMSQLLKETRIFFTNSCGKIITDDTKRLINLMDSTEKMLLSDNHAQTNIKDYVFQNLIVVREELAEFKDSLTENNKRKAIKSESFDTACVIDSKNTTLYLNKEELRQGTIILKKYRVDECMNSSEIGYIYLGSNLDNNEKIRIYQLFCPGLVQYKGEPREVSAVNDLMDRIESMALLSGIPGIVGIDEFVEDDNTQYGISKYYTCTEPLKDCIRNNSLSWEEVLRTFEPIIKGMIEVHRRGVGHFGISPQNLFVDESGDLFLTGFEESGGFIKNVKNRDFYFTDSYSAPELYSKHENKGEWTDVYSLSAIMYRCITGKVPVNALDRMVKDSMESTRQLGIDIPSYVDKAIMKGMEPSIPGRFNSVHELHDALYTEKRESIVETLPNEIKRLFTNRKIRNSASMPNSQKGIHEEEFESEKTTAEDFFTAEDCKKSTWVSIDNTESIPPKKFDTEEPSLSEKELLQQELEEHFLPNLFYSNAKDFIENIQHSSGVYELFQKAFNEKRIVNPYKEKEFCTTTILEEGKDSSMFSLICVSLPTPKKNVLRRRIYFRYNASFNEIGCYIAEKAVNDVLNMYEYLSSGKKVYMSIPYVPEDVGKDNESEREKWAIIDDYRYEYIIAPLVRQ